MEILLEEAQKSGRSLMVVTLKNPAIGRYRGKGSKSLANERAKNKYAYIPYTRAYKEHGTPMRALHMPSHAPHTQSV